MRQPALIGTLCYLGASIAWGMNIPVTSILFHTFDAYFLAAVRLAVATLVLALIVGVRSWRDLVVPIAFWRLVLLSLSMGGFFLLYNLGLRFTHPITAAAIMAASPVYTALVMRVVTRAPLVPGFWGAALLTVIGTLIAIHGRSPDLMQGLQLQGGEVLILLSFVCWNLYSIFAQRWFEPAVSQLRRTYVAMAGTVFWLVLAWLVMHQLGVIGPPNLSPPPEAIGWLLLTAVFSSGLSVVAWNIGVSTVGLAAGAVWQNTVPVFAVLVSLLFGIVPTPGQVLGGCVVIAGVAYMQWRRSRATGALPEAARG